jgi:protein SCO1/2
MVRRWAVAVGAALVLVVSACSSSGDGAGGRSTAGNGLHGFSVNTPIPAPALVLTDQDGQPYDLLARTKGKVTLLYFGYTHCPDVCPTTMADIAVALRAVPAQVRTRVVVVFVTSDPHRDTPAVLKTWLGRIDPAFIGLTGDIDTIYDTAARVGIALKKPEVTDGDYEVTHGSQVLAFSPDQKARVVYTEGTTSDDYAHDLPLLVDTGG